MLNSSCFFIIEFFICRHLLFQLYDDGKDVSKDFSNQDDHNHHIQDGHNHHRVHHEDHVDHEDHEDHDDHNQDDHNHHRVHRNLLNQDDHNYHRVHRNLLIHIHLKLRIF